MKKPKFKIGDLVATYIDGKNKKEENIILGWIIKVYQVPIELQDHALDDWRYDIEWADNIVEADMSETTIGVIVNLYRNSKRYNRWKRSLYDKNRR